ncbi:response regulator receiver protein [Spirochaeta thermophila DSM 6578]|uniref:Response regulator receiver protein n=1 Tax=Winmispira thermophila (strain ATCC 700085 / DSM 6578 / Z-1203) TaxID=869211 RepID=G0GEX3_WINT7|nr:response regulator [Spirochaeta thermophila]AEJ62317.1 response regulator receiver protein [Spirochaeta thermophila DSM 6578]
MSEKDLPHILLVEDDDAIRLSLRDFLSKDGRFHVHVASDGLGALRILIDHDIQCIVTDYRLSGLGGDYWIRFLKKFCGHLPVIVISGFLEPGFEIPFPLIYKPFDYEEILRNVSECLGK